MIRRLLKWFLQLLPAALLIWGLVGLIEPWLGYTVNLVVRSAVALLVAVLYTVLLNWVSDSGADRHKLPTAKPKFVDFYSNWYAREGQVHIYCSDMHWLNPDGRQKIVDELCRKGAQAHVYLRDRTGPVVESLERSGVQIFNIPPTVRLDVKFSLLMDSGYRVLIIRSKVTRTGVRKRGSDREEVLETQDEYLVPLAVEFLESLRSAQLAGS